MVRYINGPYQLGKLFCAFCGEWRKYGVDAATMANGRLRCTECGLQIRMRGRYSLTKYVKTYGEPKRY